VFIIDFFIELWKTLNSENNDPIIIGMIAVMFALLINNYNNHKNSKKLLREKDERIKELREERNKYQNIFLKQIGGERKSSKDK